MSLQISESILADKNLYSVFEQTVMLITFLSLVASVISKLKGRCYFVFVNVVDGLPPFQHPKREKQNSHLLFMTSDLKTKIAHYLLLDDFPGI